MSSLLQSTGSSPYILVHIVGPLAATLPVTNQLAAKLRFVDYGNMLELNSSVNRSVEYHG